MPRSTALNVFAEGKHPKDQRLQSDKFHTDDVSSLIFLVLVLFSSWFLFDINSRYIGWRRGR